MATAAQVAQQRQVQQALAQAAEAELRAYWRSLNLANPEAARDALLEYMPALVRKYGNAAGVAAADFYDTLRADSATTRAFKAAIADADDEAVTAATRRLAGVLFGDDPASALPGLAAVVDKQVKAVGRRTIELSGSRDPASPRYARVPQGVKTCDWCLDLGSRGFVYASEQSAAGEMSRYHHHCDCIAVPDFSDDPRLEGYDPDALYEAYQARRAAQ